MKDKEDEALEEEVKDVAEDQEEEEDMAWEDRQEADLPGSH